MAHSLSERQERYESDFDSTILNRIPVVIRCTIRNYKRLTQRLERPCCAEFSEVMSQTMLYTITNIPDALAAASVMMMGEGSEQIPIVMAEDATSVEFVERMYKPRKPYSSFEIPLKEDLYGPIIDSAPWRKGGGSGTL